MTSHSRAQPVLILGSSSPFRKALLERLMVPFEVAQPNIDERPKAGESALALVRRLAIEKAQAVAHALGSDHPNALIIGSDQVALHGTQIVGKPLDHDDAVAQLTQASGHRIELHTGLALLNTQTGNTQSDVVTFCTHFKTLTPHTIERYLRKEKPYNCAGSLKSEGLGIALLERFEGDDPSALIGLPLIRLIAMLEAEGFDLFV